MLTFVDSHIFREHINVRTWIVNLEFYIVNTNWWDTFSSNISYIFNNNRIGLIDNGGLDLVEGIRHPQCDELKFESPSVNIFEMSN